MAGLNPALIPFWKTKSRYKVLYGGRSSSKSYDAASHSIRLARSGKFKILCTRQFQANIRESVYTLLKDRIYAFNLQDEFKILGHSITHKYTGSEFIFMGIARNIDEIKSLEAVDIMWVEEATLLTKDQWDVILPTIRKQNSEVWLIFNPRYRSDFVYQRFIEHPHTNSAVRHINYTENPFLSDTMKEVIDEAKEEDYEEYKHIYLGVPREGDEKALFTFDEVEKAMDNSTEAVAMIDMTGVMSYGIDVARYGNDKGCSTKRKGYRIYDLVSYNDYSTMELANAVSGLYHGETDRSPDGIFIDVIGVGAGVYDRAEELGLPCIEANASNKAEKIDIYYNKRAEMYFGLKEWMKKGGIIPNDRELKEELLSIRYTFNKLNGKIIIQPKDEIKELIGRSPDKSDSVALHFFSTISTTQTDIGQLQKNLFRKRNKR